MVKKLNKNKSEDKFETNMDMIFIRRLRDNKDINLITDPL